MKAMILAAGRGERMRPLTDQVPKPLLAVSGKALIVWQIEALVDAGFNRIVINHAWLGRQIEDAVGDGSHWGIRIAWSREGEALETAGGIATAMPLIQGDDAIDEPFLVVSADIHSDYDYTRLVPIVGSIRTRWPAHAAHLVLVDNPPWHAEGDMALVDGLIARSRDAGPSMTYANIAVFHPRCFDDVPMHTRLALFPWAYRFADERRMTGTRHDGAWDNVGTPEQLAALDRRLKEAPLGPNSAANDDDADPADD